MCGRHVEVCSGSRNCTVEQGRNAIGKENPVRTSVKGNPAVQCMRCRARRAGMAGVVGLVLSEQACGEVRQNGSVGGANVGGVFWAG